MTGDPRIETLSSRVRWVDRNRRRMSRAAALLVMVVGLVGGPTFFGATWHQLGPAGLMIVFVVIAAAFLLGFVTDLVLAVVTAKWETSAAQLARDGGLPRAVARKTQSPP